jgi:hypothetical protein
MVGCLILPKKLLDFCFATNIYLNRMNYRCVEAPLKDKRQTAEEIKWLVNNFYGDLDKIDIMLGGRKKCLADLSLNDYYDFVRKLPYKKDNKPVEIVGRPKYILEQHSAGLDCKKKAVLMAAFLKLHKIPYRFIGASSRSDGAIHHIYPEANLNGKWTHVDATYTRYRIGKPKQETASEIL